MAEKAAKPAKKAVEKKAAKGPKDTHEAAGPAKAIILNYRGGVHTRRLNQMLIEVEGADTKSKASSYIGRSLVWKTPSGRLLYGKITHPHGNHGVLRARFVKGLPGESLGKEAKVL